MPRRDSGTRAPIDAIEVGDRSRKVLRNIDSLARSIRDRGLLQPVPVREVDGSYVLVCGQRRIEACRSLGWAEIPVYVLGSDMDELEALYAEGDENTEREPFTPTEAVEHRRRIRAVEAKAAKERQRTAIKKRDDRGRAASSEPKRRAGGSAPSSTNLEEVEPTKPQRHTSETRHRTAKATGYSASTLDKAEEVAEAAEDESQAEPVRAAARSAVTNLGSPGAKVDREFKAFKDEQAKHNPDVAAANFRKQLTRQLGLAADLELYSTERAVEVADADLLEHIDACCRAVERWYAAVNKLRGSGMRVVDGGSR